MYGPLIKSRIPKAKPHREPIKNPCLAEIITNGSMAKVTEPPEGSFIILKNDSAKARAIKIPHSAIRLIVFLLLIS